MVDISRADIVAQTEAFVREHFAALGRGDTDTARTHLFSLGELTERPIALYLEAMTQIAPFDVISIRPFCFDDLMLRNGKWVATVWFGVQAKCDLGVRYAYVLVRWFPVDCTCLIATRPTPWSHEQIVRRQLGPDALTREERDAACADAVGVVEHLFEALSGERFDEAVALLSEPLRARTAYIERWLEALVEHQPISLAFAAVRSVSERMSEARRPVTVRVFAVMTRRFDQRTADFSVEWFSPGQCRISHIPVIRPDVRAAGVRSPQTWYHEV